MELPEEVVVVEEEVIVEVEVIFEEEVIVEKEVIVEEEVTGGEVIEKLEEEDFPYFGIVAASCLIAVPLLTIIALKSISHFLPNSFLGKTF